MTTLLSLTSYHYANCESESLIEITKRVSSRPEAVLADRPLSGHYSYASQPASRTPPSAKRGWRQQAATLYRHASYARGPSRPTSRTLVPWCNSCRPGHLDAPDDMLRPRP